MIPAVELRRIVPRARDTYGPFEDLRTAAEWKRAVLFTCPDVELAFLRDGTGLDLQEPFSTVDEDAPGDWEAS